MSCDCRTDISCASQPGMIFFRHQRFAKSSPFLYRVVLFLYYRKIRLSILNYVYSRKSQGKLPCPLCLAVPVQNGEKPSLARRASVKRVPETVLTGACPSAPRTDAGSFDHGTETNKPSTCVVHCKPLCHKDVQVAPSRSVQRYFRGVKWRPAAIPVVSPTQPRHISIMG